MIKPAKPVKVDPVVEVEEQEEKLTFGLPGEQIPGASCLKYEVLEKKGQKILVPVRYSVRNQKSTQNLNTTFHTKEAMQALYEPNEMESMFTMSDTAQQTTMLLRSKIAPKLQPDDIDTVVKVYEHFVLVRLNGVGQKRF